MSYCRWSSMDFQCDLYCYADVYGGWTTHVAARRRVGVPDTSMGDLLREVQTLPKTKEAHDDWQRRYREYMKQLDQIESKEIGLPYDGQTFNDPTLEEFRDRLLHLREVGYKFPDHVIETIVQEINDQVSEETEATKPPSGAGE